MGGPSQPPLLPPSQSPEGIRGTERVGLPDDRWKSPRPEKNQWAWFLFVLAVFGLVIAGSLLVSWLLSH